MVCPHYTLQCARRFNFMYFATVNLKITICRPLLVDRVDAPAFNKHVSFGPAPSMSPGR